MKTRQAARHERQQIRERPVRSVFGYEALAAHVIGFASGGSLNEMVQMSLVCWSFKRAVRLCSLDIDFKGCSDDNTLRSLGSLGMQQMRTLDLSDCGYRISNLGLGYLRPLSNLTSLNLSNCYGIADAGLEHLQSLTKLTSLNL